MSAFRNVPYINKISLYGSSKQSMMDVFDTQETIAYDEMLGMKLAFEERGLKQYINRHIFADIVPYTNMVCNDIYNLPGQFYEWKEGTLYWCIKILGRIIRIREVTYIHLQKRKMLVDEVLGDDMFIYKNCISCMQPKDKSELTTIKDIFKFYKSKAVGRIK